MAGPEPQHSLKILHVLRAPVGGLFRHVIDLARGQTARGHRVGIIADSLVGGARAFEVLGEVADILALGVNRLPMSRHIGLADMTAWRRVASRVHETDVDVVHGHGAKGGAYARLTRSRAIRVYTPHGGSLHYDRASPVGFAYLGLEQILSARTDLVLFESAFAEQTFRAKIGPPRGLVRVVHNGVADAEFAPVETAAEATDLVFVGELRALKGIDVLIDAIVLLARDDRPVTVTIVGDGPDAEALKAKAATLGGRVRFLSPMPARAAFALGRVMVVPSRAESLPYIVLEAAAAGMPLIASNVGGIPEIFGDNRSLTPPGNPAALAGAIAAVLADLPAARTAAQALRARVKTAFSLDNMVDGVLTAYGDTYVSLKRG